MLSRKPSKIWEEYFINCWNHPPKFTTSHRSRNASIEGNKIILDGVTIEEVKEYHRDTLILCINEANEKEKAYLEKEAKRKQITKENEAKHRAKIIKESEDIKF